MPLSLNGTRIRLGRQIPFPWGSQTWQVFGLDFTAKVISDTQDLLYAKNSGNLPGLFYYPFVACYNVSITC
jgi:hypothetical protein